EVALAGGTPAEHRRGLESVGRAHRARSRARLGDVAVARRRAAGRPGVAGGVLTVVARPVAQIRAARIAVVGAAGARRRLRVGGTARTGARTVLGRVALAGRRATDGGRRLEGVGGADGAGARAGLRDVACSRYTAAGCA